MVYDNYGLIIANSGWSEAYQGSRVESQHGYVQEHGQGSEAFNFLPGPNGLFYGYIRQTGLIDVDTDLRWIVVFVSKPEGSVGLRIVGWYEDAQFEVYSSRPEYESDDSFPRIDETGLKFHYSAIAPIAYLVPDLLRTEYLPKGHRIKTGGVYFAQGGPDQRDSREQAKARRAMAKSVFASLDRLRSQLDSIDLEGPEGDEGPAVLSDPALRAEVDEKAMAAVRQDLESKGYKVADHSKLPVSYDLEAVLADERLLVEVKGTHRAREAFFISRNEFAGRKRKGWQLAVVTNVTSDPKINYYSALEMAERFNVRIHSYVATQRNKTEN